MISLSMSQKIKLAIVAGALATSSLAYAQQKDGLECRYLTVIEQGFLANHVKYSVRDSELQTRVVEQYLKRLDPSKIYLTQPDIDQIKKITNNVFDKTKNKDCAFLDQTQKIVLERVKDRLAFAKLYLGKDFKFDPATEFTFDPEKKAWPKDTAEANDYLKKYIQFQIGNYMATDMKMEEAKKNVIKNYERAVKRTQDTTEDDLYSGYLDSFARALDPHSSFFSRDVLEDFEIQMRLSLEGIGATLSSQDGFTVVEQLVPGGAAAKSGLIEPQDKIVAVGQEKGPMENVIDQDLKDVVKKIRGAKGTKVRLTILRKTGDGKKRMDVTLVREKVSLEDDAASITFTEKEVGGVKKKLGIINFPSFYADSRRGGRSSAADLKKIIKEANEKKADGLVLDLSTNGGGSLEDAVKIAGLFFQTGNVVKQSSKNEGRAEAALRDTDPTVDWAGPLVVLTSRISASASEIVSGTLQDYKRAVIVGGDHTYGKGSVQSVLPIPNDLGAIKVTVGMFFIPGGKSTQHRGVDADIVLPGPFSTDDVGEKYMDYSLPPKTIDAFLSPEAYVKEGPSAWKEVKTEWVKSMKDRSTERVAKNEEFKKIVDELNKAKARGKVIRVSEVLKDKNEKEKKDKAKKTASKAKKNEEYLKRPDIQEAESVLLDLILLQEGKALLPLKQASAK
ncbi:tail-specific protease [Bdellovibrio bacteriovorus]|uniref:Tail-specific protease n=1 Tax=Bdellovibrio bacteriovorus TaxID=959 RepID=A0A150WEW0_BDEBC|nr:S41 family peptidase [Bdellovibrio bacteriovorus]KYG61463.1 tail-specific protease [Bdellovibrio bacteriovorus]